MKICLLWNVILLIAVHRIFGIQHEDCGTEDAVILGVEVQNCPGNVCKLKKGTNATLQLSFKTENIVEKLHMGLYGVIHGIPMPFPGEYEQNVCTSPGVDCPIQPGVVQNYSLTIPVSKHFPTVPAVKIKIKMNDTICIMIPAQVVK